jgi:hypothetical protein
VKPTDNDGRREQPSADVEADSSVGARHRHGPPILRLDSTTTLTRLTCRSGAAGGSVSAAFGARTRDGALDSIKH